jgi:hypothetical protein
LLWGGSLLPLLLVKGEQLERFETENLQYSKCEEHRLSNDLKFASLFFVVIMLGTFLVDTGTVGAVDEQVSVFVLGMPEEYIDYTVCVINGSLWAKVDGTYPLGKLWVDSNSQPETVENLFTFNEGPLTFCYPTPPGTTNITVSVDDTEVSWSNYTEITPDALHYTAVGNWSMIICEISPASDRFVLKIHYEHPIQQTESGYKFLYDLNISPYLSPWSNKSTAHFNIHFEVVAQNIEAVTVAADGTTKPIEYTVTPTENAQTIALNVSSNYSKPLLGDLLISFSEDTEQVSSGFSGSGFALELVYGVTAVVAFGFVLLAGYMIMRKKHGDGK